MKSGAKRLSFRAGNTPPEKDLPHRSALAFTPDGKTLLVAKPGGNVLRWDTATGKEGPPLSRLAEDATGIGNCGFFVPPEGRTLVTVGYRGLGIRRWDLTTGREIASVAGYTGDVRALLSPDGRQVVIGDRSGRLELHDAPTGRPVRVLREKGPGIHRLRWSPDCRLLAVEQINTALWDTVEGRVLHVFGKESEEDDAAIIGDPGDAINFSPDGRYVLACTDQKLHRWEVSTGTETWGVEHCGPTAYSPDGKSIAACCVRGHRNGFLAADTGAVLAPRTEEESPSTPVEQIVFSPDGSWLGIRAFDYGIEIRDPQTGALRRQLREPQHTFCSSIAGSPDGKWILSGGSDGSIRILEVATGKELLRRDGHAGWVRDVSFAPDVRRALSSSSDSTALLWDLHPAKSAARTDRASLWNDLASDNGPTIYRAIWELREDPVTAVTLLRAKLLPGGAPPEQTVGRLIADLDNDTFEKRERAEHELAALGPGIVPRLKSTLATTTSLEVRRRLEKLVRAKTPDPGPEDFRRQRAVQALELAGTPESRALLAEWAAGPSQAPLAEDARAALGRLKKADKRFGARDP